MRPRHARPAIGGLGAQGTGEHGRLEANVGLQQLEHPARCRLAVGRSEDGHRVGVTHPTAGVCYRTLSSRLSAVEEPTDAMAQAGLVKAMGLVVLLWRAVVAVLDATHADRQ